MVFDKNAMPESVDVERQVLSAMLVRAGERIPEVLSILNADDFFRVENRIIFKHIVNLYLRGIAPNLYSLIDEMQKTGEYNKIGYDYLAAIDQATFTNAVIVSHAKIVKEKSDLRRVMGIAEDIFQAAQKGVMPVADIIGKTQKDFSNFANVGVSRFSTYGDYFKQNFKSEVQAAIKYSLRETGFNNIDNEQIFNAGLYLIGATPAAGKTTFCWQMAEQLAENGETCIYCTYEMSRLELFSKSVASELFKRNSTFKLTAAEIRRGKWTAEIDRIIEEKQTADFDLRVLELQNETVDELLNLIRPLCVNQSKSPVVFVDYLQIIPSVNNNIKNGIDETVRKLKTFQRETNTTFIVISSFNRTNYSNSVSFESFKESGGIEYTADVVWGLQLNILNLIKSTSTLSQSRTRIEQAKKQQPRQINLKCLKNRQGSNYECYFKYFSAHDYFLPCELQDFEESDNENVLSKTDDF